VTRHAPFVDNPTGYFSALHAFLDDVLNTTDAAAPPPGVFGS